mmetsp:Transcript_168057/g.539662  ORF Transcript_168057/g.539662 Transcript_168057/m.539662 type:complete len:608 (-) Transcript_168057:76-1899(-)
MAVGGTSAGSSALAGPAPTNGGGSLKAPLGGVEVLRDVDSKVWYCGHVVDIGSKETLTVGFDGDVWPKASYPFNRVRKPPRPSAVETERFDPQIGDEVELRVEATEHSCAGWASATVRKIKHGFYFVARVPAAASESSEAIVEKDMLRLPTPNSPLVVLGMQQETYKLPPGLQGWITTPDALGCFGHIEEQSHLAFLHAQKNSLKLFGDAKAIARAKMLLEVHVKHQVKIQDFQDKREKGLRALESKRSRIEGTGYKHSVEVHVDPSYIARIIGKGGEAIKALQEKYDVNVRILDSDDADVDRIVRIFGNSMESIEKARADVEFVEEAVSVEPDMYNWVVGRGGRTIQSFRDSCGLIYARLDRDQQRVLLCGPKVAVQEAVAMFESHIMYFPVFRQMDEEMGQIISQLEEYGDYNARWEWNWFRDQEEEEHGGGRSGKGGKQDSKGKGKGKPKGDAKPEKANGVAKDSKGKNKGRSKGLEDEEQDEEEVEEEEEEDEETERPPTRGKGDKGGSKGASKGGRGIARWQPVGKDAADEDEDEDEEAEEDEDRPPPQKGAGRGRGKTGVTGKGGRASAASASVGGSEAGAKPGGASGPSGRRMGKKGVRS